MSKMKWNEKQVNHTVMTDIGILIEKLFILCRNVVFRETLFFYSLYHHPLRFCFRFMQYVSFNL
jgi:hypothetical protein